MESSDTHSLKSLLNSPISTSETALNAPNLSVAINFRQVALSQVIARIRASLDLATIFETTAKEVRELLNADRVGVFWFYPTSSYDDGEFVSEDVIAPYESALAAKIHDHCFGEQYAKHYANGRVQAIGDIYQSGLQNCHIDVLSQFQVRANLAVPILKRDKLWGLLCIHQCSGPREWQSDEIEFIRQIAEQFGVALYQAKLLEQMRYQTEQQQALFNVVNRIRESLDLESIFKTAATAIRQAMNADRVGIFRFDPESGYDDGEFVSEDVRTPYPSVLAAKIHDHCFGEDYAPHYTKGRIQAVEDIYQAGLQDCHVEVLAQFQIRANLVVPLLQGTKLWGLLCIHQCASARQWQSAEVEFIRQVASQLSVALKQAELLEYTRQQAQELSQALNTIKQAQTQLIQSEKMSSLGQLVAGVAHEINNPVNFIYGNLVCVTQYAQDLLDLVSQFSQELESPSPKLSDRLADADLEFIQEDFPKLLSSMHLGANRIREIVLSLRNFSRLDEAEMKPVDIHEGIDSTLLILQYRLKPRPGNVAIEIHKEYGKLPEIDCYASQLNQVFMNILSNAIDALEEWRKTNPEADQPQPFIRICTSLDVDRTGVGMSQDQPMAVIQITNNGPSIPEHVLPRLFDPFFTTKIAGKGTGLGLSISHQIIVERHGGNLRCYSHPEKGTEFRIEIPTRQPEPKIMTD
ncbi:MAG: GAF domain-containing protein [Leptolyngbyaceae bacterium]|nr:GAF domain-containing protein [Leptolyngbyaceae bacterium]